MGRRRVVEFHTYKKNLSNILNCEFFFEDMANGFEELLKYDGNVEEDFGVTFEVPVDFSSFFLIF